MTIQQISVFLENKPGTFRNVAAELSKNGVNMRAMSVADTADFGILRMIVDDNEKTKKVLADGGYIYKETEVLAVEVGDTPGSLMRILETLGEAAINLEYMYAFTTKKNDGACLIFRVDDVAKTTQVLSDAGIKLASAEELKEL
ncbi:MAG: ACT domain-containing protein [Bacillota bacterium]|jgi:hypothetical protein